MSKLTNDQVKHYVTRIEQIVKCRSGMIHTEVNGTGPITVPLQYMSVAEFAKGIVDGSIIPHDHAFTNNNSSTSSVYLKAVFEIPQTEEYKAFMKAREEKQKKINTLVGGLQQKANHLMDKVVAKLVEAEDMPTLMESFEMEEV